MKEFTSDDLDYLSKFEKITDVFPKDFIMGNSMLVFLVSTTELGKAIGKKGVNIAKLKSVFNRKVAIVPDSDDPETFTRSFFNNVKVFDVETRNVMGEKSFVITVDEMDRGLAIGKNGDKIKAAKVIFKKKFDASIHLRTRRNIL